MRHAYGKNTILMLLLGVLTFLCSCNQTRINNTSQNPSDPPKVTSVGEETEQVTCPPDIENSDNNSEDVFIWLPTEAEGSLDAFYQLSSPQSQGLCTKVETVVDDKLKNTVKETPLGSFTYESSRYSLKTTISGEYGTFYSSYDVYKDDNGAEMTYLHGTDLMTFYYDSHENSIPSDLPSLTQDEMLTLANDFLATILPEETVNNCTDIIVNLPDNFHVGTVCFTRTIYGYDTDEDIMVMIDEYTHEVIAYNGECVGKYDTLVGKVTQEALDKAKTKLIAKVASMGIENISKQICSLTTNSEGELFMKLSFEYSYSAEENDELYAMADSIMTKVVIP